MGRRTEDLEVASMTYRSYACAGKLAATYDHVFFLSDASPQSTLKQKNYQKSSLYGFGLGNVTTNNCERLSQFWSPHRGLFFSTTYRKNIRETVYTVQIIVHYSPSRPACPCSCLTGGISISAMDINSKS